MEKPFKIIRPGETEPGKKKVITDLQKTEPSKRKIISRPEMSIVNELTISELTEALNKNTKIIDLNEQKDEAAAEKFRIFYKISLAKELAQRSDPIPFPGIKIENYKELKSVEEEFPEYCVPIDPLLERFKNEGFRVVFPKKHPESGNVFIVPSQSTDVENDNLFPWQLDTDKVLDEDLKKLILLDAPKK
jgi:hypothetical protein